MGWGGPGFVLAIIAIVMAAGIVKTAIRAKHGYPLDDEYEGKGKRHRNRDRIAVERQALLMAQQNEQLQGKVLRLEERIAVLERIATDPAVRTAREIDALR
ncbi:MULTISPECIES: hypothetical protein [unclassified Sphingomonas]|uniref:hypothetical protein n=1 Tax=unclassified Sphingomonas TaxID=196159 RepID=UPI000700A74F|nr:MULTISPECIES: hypothetical protein [unclassified Sphingomonas]KQM98226.1 hypothetical protein ASE78_08230 [Sphingomonas sp. Leaf25]